MTYILRPIIWDNYNITMSNQQGRTTRSSPTLVPFLSEPERLLHDANTGRSFVTAVQMDPNAPIRDGVASATQSFAKTLQALNVSDHRLEPDTSRIDHTQDRIDMSLNSSLHQMMQRMTTPEVDRIAEAKLKTKHTQAAEEDLMDMLKIGYADASAGLKDASNQYVENVLTEMTLKGTLEDLLIKNQTVESNTEVYGRVRMKGLKLEDLYLSVGDLRQRKDRHHH